MFVALEVLSLPLYLLCGLARRRRLLSQEAAMKYFLLGAFSSGFFLYGVALVYGYAGSMDFAEINEAVATTPAARRCCSIGMGMLAVGLLFKVGAAPFQAWTPDVYQGAPTAVTAFMAAGTKVAAFGALLRLFYVAFGADRWTWQPMMWVDRDPDDGGRRGAGGRRRPTSSGCWPTPRSPTPASCSPASSASRSLDRARRRRDHLASQAVLFYLVTYGFATLGAFAVVTWSATPAARRPSCRAGRAWARSRRWWPALFAFFLLAMAGIPLTAGFIGKWAVFAVALSAGAWPVVIVAVLMSASWRRSSTSGSSC